MSFEEEAMHGCIFCSAEKMNEQFTPLSARIAGSANVWATLASVMRRGMDATLRATCERHVRIAKRCAEDRGFRWPDAEPTTPEPKPS